MPPESEPPAQQRLHELLALLAEQGVNQAQVAARAGLPTQYLSDIKHGRRPITELVARRIGDEFSVNYQWLMGAGVPIELTKLSSSSLPGTSSSWLPLFPHPIEGDPRALSTWDGTGIEVAGVASAKLALAKWPYVLRFAHEDVDGRIHAGDLVLISQYVDEHAEISVVRYRKKSFLARLKEDRKWYRLATGEALSSDCQTTGHCVGIIWSSLIRPR